MINSLVCKISANITISQSLLKSLVWSDQQGPVCSVLRKADWLRLKPCYQCSALIVSLWLCTYPMPYGSLNTSRAGEEALSLSWLSVSGSMYRGEVSNWSCSWPITALEAGQDTAGNTRGEDEDIKAPCGTDTKHPSVTHNNLRHKWTKHQQDEQRLRVAERHQDSKITLIHSVDNSISPRGSGKRCPACSQKPLHTWWSPLCSSGVKTREDNLK